MSAPTWVVLALIPINAVIFLLTVRATRAARRDFDLAASRFREAEGSWREVARLRDQMAEEARQTAADGRTPPSRYDELPPSLQEPR